MNIIPFEPEHFQALRLQSQDLRLAPHFTLQYWDVLKSAGPAFSGEVDGRIVACAGIATQFTGMGTMWAAVAADASPSFVRLHKCAMRLLQLTPLRRIEATAEADFSPACRWLELLGFQSEGLMRAYGPDGRDHWRYARVR
jgi:hypothetical protein